MGKPYTDLAREVFCGPKGRVPPGVRRGQEQVAGTQVLRLWVERAGLARPRGRYVTVETPYLSRPDGEEALVLVIARELTALLPPDGPVLVAGLGNRALAADALGPMTVDGVWATRGIAPPAGVSLRQVSAVALGPGGKTGLSSAELLRALTEKLVPRAVLCVDALCCAAPNRLGATVQLTDAGIAPGSGAGAHKEALTARTLGVPVIAIGVPTVLDTGGLLPGQMALAAPRDVDELARKSAGLLAAAINRALQPGLSGREVSAILS